MVLGTILGYAPEKAVFLLKSTKEFIFTVFLEKRRILFLFFVKLPFFSNLY
jgi:hypothetical protein